ncbi:MAG: hypothetical protein JXR41_12215 [Bacteroidales bacterium]|nr:hypothetical protein [Bacteroidales bacterium]MBN2763850.1 hypothetical protein [Bacteroidales bacterium]
MKKFFFFTSLVCGLTSALLNAGTFRVNNKLADNPAAKIYSDLQEAHDAAFNGDTIMVEGSPDNYSGVNITKKLIIKGPGYFLDENPGISANKISTQVNTVSFADGSGGSVVMGLESFFDIREDDITIRRCHASNINLYANCENITISECYFDINLYGDCIYAFGYIATNLVVVNCMINGGVSIYNGSTGVFLNNILNTELIDIPTGFDLKNNILCKAGKENVKLPALPDPDVSYNLSISDHFGTDNHNQANISEEALFLGALSNSTDGKWQLKEGSPALSAGEGGVDCGAYGGPQPYQLSGLPAGPVIYELNVSSYSTEDNKLPVTIKVKSY